LVTEVEEKSEAWNAGVRKGMFISHVGGKRVSTPAEFQAAAKSVGDRNPKAEIENKFTVTTAYYAAAVRPGDFDLLQFLRTWVFLNKQKGILADIYQKYTQVALVDLPAM